MKHRECKTYPAGVGRDGIIELGVIQTLDVQISRGERVSGGPLAALPPQYRCVSSHLHRTSVFH